eukprot:COSAG06_NODE_3597_length_5138_cov_4.401865_2_plen_227_part_00
MLCRDKLQTNATERTKTSGLFLVSCVFNTSSRSMSFHLNERRAVPRQASDKHKRRVREKHPIVLSAVCSLTVADGNKVRRRLRKTAFLSHLYIKCIILPRQARDKHRENSKKDAVFRTVSSSSSRCVPTPICGAVQRQDLVESVDESMRSAARFFRPELKVNCEAKWGDHPLDGLYVCPEPVLVKRSFVALMLTVKPKIRLTLEETAFSFFFDATGTLPTPPLPCM